MINENEIHKAVDYICYKAPDAIAEAKERKVIAENYLKTIKSDVILKSTGTVSEKEAKALTDGNYLDAITKYAAAVKELEYQEQLAEAAKIKIQVWQTDSKNKREVKI